MDLTFILIGGKNLQSLQLEASQPWHNVQVFGETSLTQCLFDGDSDAAPHWKVSRTSLVPVKAPHLLRFDPCRSPTFHGASATWTGSNTPLVSSNLRYRSTFSFLFYNAITDIKRKHQRLLYQSSCCSEVHLISWACMCMYNPSMFLAAFEWTTCEWRDTRALGWSEMAAWSGTSHVLGYQKLHLKICVVVPPLTLLCLMLIKSLPSAHIRLIISEGAEPNPTSCNQTVSMYIQIYTAPVLFFFYLLQSRWLVSAAKTHQIS